MLVRWFVERLGSVGYSGSFALLFLRFLLLLWLLIPLIAVFIFHFAFVWLRRFFLLHLLLLFGRWSLVPLILLLFVAPSGSFGAIGYCACVGSFDVLR